MPEFDLRDDVIGILDLVNLDTPDGEFGFLLGVDGVFTDVTGKAWVGSTALGSDRLQSAINGVAPEGRIAFSFFQDPQQPDLVEQVKALGIGYLTGRAISFWYQPISSVAELNAPVLPPRKWLTRTIRTLSVRANGARDRTLSLGFEAWTEDRRAARRITLDTRGHAQLIGAANPSLEFRPTSDFTEEKLFG
ncbi:MAG: hypothetical protein CML02_02495 [Pseudooceanicola sp.]|nr:hypothetical protein [Pseudooceanicola sp.]